MRSVSLFVVLLFCLYACKNKTATDVHQQAKATKEAIDNFSPGMEPTAENGYYMKATVDGKEWIAAGMIHDEGGNSSFKQVRGENGDIALGFQLWKQGTKTGEKRPFRDDYAADLSTADEFLRGIDGELAITKADDIWIEGIFHFKATSTMSDKKMEVTNGFFRVSAK
jgi:hypothetical protein